MPEAEIADRLVALHARRDDLARDEDELVADGERQFLATAEEVFHAAADERDGAAVALGQAAEDGAHAQAGGVPPAVGRADGDAAAVLVVDGQDGGDGGVWREIVAADGRQGGLSRRHGGGGRPPGDGGRVAGGSFCSGEHCLDVLVVHDGPPLLNTS